MTTQTRLSDLLSVIPGGSFYSSNGRVIPYKNGPTSFRLITNFPNDTFLILINGVQSGYVTTDVNGNAIFDTQLPLGDVVVELQRQNSTDKVIAYVTTRNYTTWLASIAEQLEKIDDHTENTLDSFYLAAAKTEDINLAHGVPLIYPNESAAELEAYREMLQLVRQSSRQFAGMWSGKAEVIAALTQVNPLIFYRRQNGPRWILGYDLLPNSSLQQLTRYMITPDGLANINASGQFVRVDAAGVIGVSEKVFYDNYHELWYNPYFNSLVLVAQWTAPRFSEIPPISGNGTYTVYAGTPQSSLSSLPTLVGPMTSPATRLWPMVPGSYDHLYVELDFLGVIADVWMWYNLGGALTLADKVNAFIKSSPYGVSRRINYINDYIECVTVSSGTPLGTASIQIAAGPTIRYQAPGDSWGVYQDVVLSSRMTLPSGTTANNIVVNVGNAVTIGVTTFQVYARYAICSNAYNNKLTINSQIAYPGLEGRGGVAIHDGPSNIATSPISGGFGGLFDTPKIRTTLSAAVTTGATQISVPFGTAPYFSSVRGEVSVPFDVVFGNGFKNKTISSFTIVPDAGEQTATLAITGDIFNAGDNYASLIINGAAPLFTPTVLLNAHVTINSISTNTPIGIGNLQVTNVLGTLYLQYAAPGDNWGATVTISPLGGTTNVFSLDTSLSINITYDNAVVVSQGRFFITANNDERNTGVHQILQILSPTSAKIAYRGLGVSVIQPFRSTYIVAVDAGSIVSGPSGTLEYSVAIIGGARKFRWQAPGDSYGALVQVLPSAQNVRVYSNNGRYLDILVDYYNMVATPGTYTKSINIYKFGSYTKQAADTIKIWSTGEQARVIQVDPLSPEIWHLENAAVGNYDSGLTVYLAGTLPLVDTKPSLGELDVEIDQAYAPTFVTSDTDIAAIGGAAPGLPDGWIDTGTNSPGIYLTTNALLNDMAVLIQTSAAAGDIQLEHDVVVTEQMIGVVHTLKVWMRNVNIYASPSVNVYLGFNFGGGWVESPLLSIPTPQSTLRQSQLLTFSQTMPRISSMKVRIRVVTGALEQFILDRVVLENSFIALFLGHNTTPRSQSRSGFGSLMYVWGADELSTAEINMLGIPNIAYPSGRGGVATGRIREAHNSMETADIFDITDVVSGSVVNVRGHVTDVEWASASLTNLEIITRVPARFSYVCPTRISAVSETLSVNPGPYTATLLVTSDQDQLKAMVYANDIPLPIDEWQFNSPTEIEILTGFIPTAVYRIEYNALIRIETAPIDILSPGNNGNDTWFADYLAWNRQVSNIATLRGTVSVIFDANYTASLARRSDQNKLKSVLMEDTGVSRRIIPSSSWDYVDSATISINGADFNPDAIYSLEYNQRFVSPDRAVDILAEVRSAASVFSLSTATYTDFSPHTNSAVDGSLRFHQIRLTLNGVTDIRDVRVHSAVVKGLRLNTSPVVPGI